MPPAPTLHNTCAVIVTFHPEGDFNERIGKIMSQFPLVIVVDNASQPNSSLDGLYRMQNVRVIANQENLGIATALNQGVSLAMQEGFEWVVTLDQDTILAQDMLATLIEVYQKSECKNVVIGSNYWDALKGRDFIRCADTESAYQERKTLITSGTLVPLSLFKTIGYFREDFFIDSVDHEFCLRARANGCRMLISCRSVMMHSVGVHVEDSSRLRMFMSVNHSPTRKYYIARNTIATVKSYLFREPLWCMRQGGRLLSDFASILLFESEKSKRVVAFTVGLKHGITGKMGSIEKAWSCGSH